MVESLEKRHLVTPLLLHHSSPAVRARVDALLKAHPRYEQDLLEWMPQGYEQPARFAFAIGSAIGTETICAPITSFSFQPKPLAGP